MPKKKQQESPEDQVRRFEAEVQKMIGAGELNPTEADQKLERLLALTAKLQPKRA